MQKWSESLTEYVYDMYIIGVLRGQQQGGCRGSDSSTIESDSGLEYVGVGVTVTVAVGVAVLIYIVVVAPPRLHYSNSDCFNLQVKKLNDELFEIQKTQLTYKVI